MDQNLVAAEKRRSVYRSQCAICAFELERIVDRHPEVADDKTKQVIADWKTARDNWTRGNEERKAA